MGNWRTVNIVGTFDHADLQAAREHLLVKADWSNFGPLSISDGLCSLGDWLGPTVMATGNLAERDYSIDDVAEALTGLVAVAPSARLKVHCGDDWEALACIATVTVADGAVDVGPAEVSTLAKLGDDVLLGRLYQALTRPPKKIRRAHSDAPKQIDVTQFGATVPEYIPGATSGNAG